jgi:hypothetical protein
MVPYQCQPFSLEEAYFVPRVFDNDAILAISVHRSCLEVDIGDMSKPRAWTFFELVKLAFCSLCDFFNFFHPILFDSYLGQDVVKNAQYQVPLLFV